MKLAVPMTACALLAAAALAGCSSGSTAASTAPSPVPSAPSQRVVESPRSATLEWFAAMNAKDRDAVEARFSATEVAAQGWVRDRPSRWGTFSHLRCDPGLRTGTHAVVSCRFTESDAPDVGQPDAGWSVDLDRTSDGHWLISNYGQG